MSYMAGQALLKKLLLTCTDFGPDDVTEGDYRVLDSGSPNVSVLTPGSFPLYDLEHMVRERRWDALCDLCTRNMDDTSYSTFGTLRDAVIAAIKAGQGMSSTYVVVGISTIGDPTNVKSPNGPFWIIQTMRITFLEFI